MKDRYADHPQFISPYILRYYAIKISPLYIHVGIKKDSLKVTQSDAQRDSFCPEQDEEETKQQHASIDPSGRRACDMKRCQRLISERTHFTACDED